MGGADGALRGKSPIVMGRLRWESRLKTLSVGQIGVVTNAAGKETGVSGRLGVFCVGSLAVLLREVGVVM